MCNMRNMFYGCNSLKFLNLTNVNTQKVIDMYGMFFGCKSKKSLDLSNFNTQNIEDMGYMFYECTAFYMFYDILFYNYF